MYWKKKTPSKVNVLKIYIKKNIFSHRYRVDFQKEEEGKENDSCYSLLSGRSRMNTWNRRRISIERKVTKLS